MKTRTKEGARRTPYDGQRELVNAVFGKTKPPITLSKEELLKEKPSPSLALAKFFRMHPAELQYIIARLVSLAKAGDLKAIDIIFDRLDGLPQQSLNVTGELPVTLKFVPFKEIEKQEDAPQITMSTEPNVIEAHIIEMETDNETIGQRKAN
jgi:hypothetical protein